MAKEATIPKIYYYSVEGVFDSEGNLRKFSIASLSRLLTDEFDLESIAYSASLAFYLEHEEYQAIDKWPLKFKFYENKASTPIELDMELSYSPCFLSKQKSIVKHIDLESQKAEQEETPDVEVKKTRKPRTKKVVEVVEEAVYPAEDVLEFIKDYHGYLTLEENPDVVPQYGAYILSLDQVDDLLTSVKSVSEEEVSIVLIKYNKQDYYLRINPEFYNLLSPQYVFSPEIAEEGELPVAGKQE